jgi:hypothetical protein
MSVAPTINRVGESQHVFEKVISVLNGNSTAKTGSLTKSFRMDEDVIRKIELEARNNNASLNSKINNILRKYVELDMLANKVGMVPIARPIVSEIFQEIMTKDQVIDLANRVAKNAIRELVFFMKGSLTLESFLLWLMTRMEYCSEVNYAIENNSHLIRIIFKHDLGENWSIYHKIIAEYIFNEILGQTTVQIEASNSALILCFN